MALPLKKFREIILQIIYSKDLNEDLDPKTFSSMLDQWAAPRKTLYQACAKVEDLFKKIDAIDSTIARFSKGYDFKRISSIERNILRLSVFEMLFEKKIPPQISISEAIRLSKKFGTPEGGAFVNGVLDAIFQSQDVLCQSEVGLNLLNR